MKFDLDHTYTSGRLQALVDCSLTYHEFIVSRMYDDESGQKFSSASYSDFKKLWTDRGLDEAEFNRQKSLICPETHVSCSDADSVFVGGGYDCKSQDCACVTQVKSNNISSQSSSIKPANEIPTQKILGVATIGMILILSLQYYNRGQ